MASDVVSLPSMAEQLGSALGIGTFGGQVFMGVLFMMLTLVPTLFLCSKRNMNPTFPSLIVAMASLCAAVPMFGFPVWIILTLFLLIGALWAGIMRNWFGGGGG